MYIVRPPIILLAVAFRNSCLNLRRDSSLQREAAQLKRTTKVIALGIGNSVNQVELNDIASAPQSKNVIRVQDFSRLNEVEEQLRNTSCRGQYSVATVIVVGLDNRSIFLWNQLPTELREPRQMLFPSDALTHSIVLSYLRSASSF